MTAGIKTPNGGYIPVHHLALADGGNQIIISLPPGGVPAGSTLIVMVRESGGNLQAVKYALK